MIRAFRKRAASPAFLAASRSCWGSSSSSGWGSDAQTPAETNAFEDNEAGSPVASGWGAPPPPPANAAPAAPASGDAAWGQSAWSDPAAPATPGAPGEPNADPTIATPFTRASDFQANPDHQDARLQRIPIDELIARVDAWLSFTEELRAMSTDNEDHLMTALILRANEASVSQLLDIVEIRWPDDTEEKWTYPVKAAIRDRIMDEIVGLPPLMVCRAMVVMGLYGRRRRDVEFFAKLGKLMVHHINEIRDPHTLCYTLVALQQSRIKPPDSFLALLSRRLPVLNKRVPLEPMPAYRALTFFNRNNYEQLNPYRFLADRIFASIKTQLKVLENKGEDFIEPKKVTRVDGTGDDDNLTSTDFDILRQLRKGDLGGIDDNPFQVNMPGGEAGAAASGGDESVSASEINEANQGGWGATPEQSTPAAEPASAGGWGDASSSSPSAGGWGSEEPAAPSGGGGWGGSDTTTTAASGGGGDAGGWGAVAADPFAAAGGDAAGAGVLDPAAQEAQAEAEAKKALEREEGAKLEAGLHGTVPYVVRHSYAAVTPAPEELRAKIEEASADVPPPPGGLPAAKLALPGYDASTRARLRMLHICKLRPSAFMNVLFILGKRKAPRQQYLKPIIRDLLLPALPHLPPPVFSRLIKACAAFASEELVLLQAIADRLVTLGPKRAFLCDALDFLRVLSSPASDSRVCTDLTLAPFLGLLREIVHDDSKLRPREMLSVGRDIMNIYRKLDTTEYSSLASGEFDNAADGANTPRARLPPETEAGLQKLSELMEHFSSRLTFLLELGVLALPQAELMMELTNKLRAGDASGAIAGLKDAVRRVSADGEDAYFDMVDIDVREIFFRTQVVNSWETFDGYRPLPAVMIQDYKACLDHMRCDYVLEAVHLYQQAYPGCLNRPVRRVLSRFILQKLKYELQVMRGGQKPDEPPPVVFKVKPKGFTDADKKKPEATVTPGALWGQGEGLSGNASADFAEMLQADIAAEKRFEQKKFNPYEPSAPRFQQMYMNEQSFMKFYNMMTLTPLRRVLDSSTTWEFLVEKSKQLNLKEAEEIAEAGAKRLAEVAARKEEVELAQLTGGKKAREMSKRAMEEKE